MKKLSLLFFILFLPCALWSGPSLFLNSVSPFPDVSVNRTTDRIQTESGPVVLTGTVSDASTGERLPAATLLIDQTYRGTTTNQDGVFTITADSLPVTLIVRYIGYEPERVTVTEADSHDSLLVLLRPAVTEMQEIVVTGDDPGLSIMELVINRKQLWREKLRAYEATAYTRQVLANDTSIVSISESASIAYWDAERGRREKQLFKEQTSNIGEDQNFAGVSYFPNFYDDDITISGFRMVGVSHPDALSYYRFSLLETTMMEGKPVYKIAVSPRRTLQPLFEGTVWVLGREYALLEVDLKPNDVVRFPPPVQEFELSYRQQFSNYGGEFWLPVDMRIEGHIRIGMIGLQFPSIRLSQISQISDYIVNQPLPDELFEQNQLFISLPDTVRLTEPVGMARIPLSREEEDAYASIDSTVTLEKAFQPEGFLTRFIDNENQERETRSGSRFSGKLGSVAPIAGYNRIDGYKAGLSWRSPQTLPGLRLTLNGSYSFNREELDYGVQIRQRISGIRSRPQLYLNGRFNRGTDARLHSGFYPQFSNGVVMLFGGNDYFDYFHNERMEVSAEVRRLYRNLAIETGLRLEKNRSYAQELTQNYSLFGNHSPRRLNPAIDDGNLNSVFLELSLNSQPNSYGAAGRNQLIVTAENSGGLLSSDFDFTHLSGSFELRFPTFYQRRIFSNTFHLTGKAGVTLGTLPLQRYGVIDGSKNIFSPFGTLRTRKGIPYEGDRYWMLAAEHDFQSIFFERLGLNWFVEKGTGIILFAAAGQSWSDRNPVPYPPMLTEGIHSEAGVSLNRIFGVARLDAAFRIDRPGWFFGISVPRYF